MIPTAASTYTDDEVTHATGLHLDNLRKLITWGAVTPVQSGGGRGRVRKWTMRQALRISVTAQFVETGFSLQMAHTLTYCLPLDDLLYVYDPEILKYLVAKDRDEQDKRLLDQLTAPDRRHNLPDSEYLGSRTLIVDGRYLYTDALGDSPTIRAVIDSKRQRVVPTESPYQFQHGSSLAEQYDLPRDTDASKIDRSSLLIDDEFLVRRKKWKRLAAHIWPEEVDSQFLGLEKIVCRSLVVINLALGLTICVRALQGLPTSYQPYETEYDGN